MTLTHIEPATYTAVETAEIVGISYRMLDYWLRNGTITISDAMPGTGHLRLFTRVEVEALKTVVGMYRTAQRIQRDLNTGTLWALTMDAHRRQACEQAS